MCIRDRVGYGQAPSSLFSDIAKFKVEYPLDKNGKDYEGVDYEDRNNPRIKNAIAENLKNYVPPSPYNKYFFTSGKEMVFRSHCAGALTSINAYPRCELREQINGEDTFWDYSDEHELNATLRITHLPDIKQEVCVVQLKGTNNPSTTNGTKEVLRVEYRQDGDSGWHLEVNESSGPFDVLKYTLGQTVKISVYVNNDKVRLKMENLDNGDTYNLNYSSEYSHGYFKAGAYTQSSIWKEKNGVGDEQPDAYSEVRFSQFILSGNSSSNNGSSSNNSSNSNNSSATCSISNLANRQVESTSKNSAKVKWTYNPTADHYNVRYKKPRSSDWKHFISLKLNEDEFTVSGSTATFEITGLSQNTEYEWQVRAKCKDGGGSSEYKDGQGPNFTTSGAGGGSDTDREEEESGSTTCSISNLANRQVESTSKNSAKVKWTYNCLLYTSPSPRDRG